MITKTDLNWWLDLERELDWQFATTYAETVYDGLATTWDRFHGMTAEEQQITADLIRSTFGDRLGRTLDVGCGTGLPMDLGLVEPVRYVGIDPSTAMLNALVMKHPVIASVHPMTYTEAEQRRVLCGTFYDTVLAIGGSASHLTTDDIERLRSRSKRDLILMHYAPGAVPSNRGVDVKMAEESLAMAGSVSVRQLRVGSFIASVVPGRHGH